ncbi:MAG: DUF5672 family protein [Sphingomonadales bacterium]|jgi:hypothetical protein
MPENLLITIPVYKNKADLYAYEMVSIANTIKLTCDRYAIALIHPPGVDVRAYSDAFKYAFHSFEFDQAYFTSIYAYNNLLKSSAFYQAFSAYEHMLLVQTDAYLFSLDLEPYTAFDFVGAPWHKHILHPEREGLFCGNGGLSLRNVHKCLEVLQTSKRLFSFKEITDFTFNSEFHAHASLWWKWRETLYYFMKHNNIKDGQNRLPYIYEDVFWSLAVPTVFKNFSVADGQTALRFSFETRPEHCYALNNNTLPLGCHGFQKYNPDFWRQFIPF